MLLSVLKCIITRKHKPTPWKRYFPLSPVCLNCGWIYPYQSERIYQKALKEINKLDNTTKKQRLEQ